jgi:hypothetical protein
MHERIIVELSTNATVELHTGNDENDKELFYANAHSLMTGQ